MNTGAEDHGSGGNDYVSTADQGSQPIPTLREVRDGIGVELIKGFMLMRLAVCLRRLIVKI